MERTTLFFDRLRKVVQYALSQFEHLLPQLLDSIVVVLGFGLIIFVLSMLMWAFWILTQIFVSLLRGLVRVIWKSYGIGLDKTLGQAKRRADQIGRE